MNKYIWKPWLSVKTDVCVGLRLSRMTMLGFFSLIICGAEGASREVSGGLLRCQYDDHHAIWISS